MDPIEFAKRHLGAFNQKGNEIIPMYCPFCKGNGRDKYTFALNTQKLTYNCKRGSCGQQGHFSQLCKEFGEEFTGDNVYSYGSPPQKEYKKPIKKVMTATQRVEGYLKLRGFSKEVWERRGVGEVGGAIAFPYYESGEVVLLKFRKPEKYNGEGQKAWREAGGKAILWGMDLCNYDDPLVIVEGEFDALALDQAGIKNVVSVPSGAEDLTWIDNCWDWLQRFGSIILWGDNDDPGRKMVKNCIKRLSDLQLFVIESRHKDANECLAREGIDMVIATVENAKHIPKYGLINLADVVRLDVRNMERVSCRSLKTLNKATGGFRMGELSVWTGKSGEGKSTLMGQLLLDALEDNAKVCAYSGELSAGQFQYWINLQAAGLKYIKSELDSSTGREIAYIPKEIEDKIMAWYNGKFWLCDNTANATGSEETSILNLFVYAAKRYGCKVFLVDNLMTARFESKRDTDFYRQQSNFVGQLVSFAKTYNVHVHLVAHPKKTKEGIEKNDISGSADIVNRCDNAFAVSRSEQGTKLKILKNRLFGVQDFDLILSFDSKSKRFSSLNSHESSSYSWENIVGQLDLIEGVF